MIILGIENLGDNLRKLFVFNCLGIVAAVELVHIDNLGRECLPKSERIDRLGVKAGDRHIIRLCDNGVIIHMTELESSVLHIFLDPAAEVNLLHILGARNLPYVSALKPRVGHLNLIAVNNLLTEKSVFIADSAAECRQL